MPDLTTAFPGLLAAVVFGIGGGSSRSHLGRRGNLGAVRCADHPFVTATHRCDGCGKALCADCLEEGHRLLTCRSCGEQAIAIEAESAASAPELARQRAAAAPYGLVDAFLYVFRGRGRYVFGSYLGLLAVIAFLSLFPIVGGIACLIGGVFIIAVLFLVPGTLFAIVRDTVAGRNEMPEWSDFSALGDRLREAFDFVVIGVVAGLPLVGLLKLLGCTGWGTMPAHCWLAWVLGWFLALVLWVPAVAGVAVYQEGWLSLRLDLHLRAAMRGGGELLITALLATILIALGQVLSVVLAALPLVGLMASAAAGMYGWFTAAHLVGLLYRQRRTELADLYGPG